MPIASTRWIDPSPAEGTFFADPVPAVGPLSPTNAEIRSQVWSLLSSFYPQRRTIERRQSQRFPYPHLIRLTPVDAEGQPLSTDRLVVAGKNLSEHGLSFHHSEPLTLRKVIASLETPDGHWLNLLMDLTWCRFTHHGWYESGGCFLQAVPTPPGMVH